MINAYCEHSNNNNNNLERKTHRHTNNYLIDIATTDCSGLSAQRRSEITFDNVSQLGNRFIDLFDKFLQHTMSMTKTIITIVVNLQSIERYDPKSLEYLRFDNLSHIHQSTIV
jgi:hypothetical protein